MILNTAQETWLAALESDEYEQGKERLKVIDPSTGNATYCCLGVACKLFIDSGGDLTERPGYGGDHVLFNGEGAIAPEPVMEWLSLFDAEGFNVHADFGGLLTKQGNKVTALTAANDAGMSFKDIAATIRKQPEMFFGEAA